MLMAMATDLDDLLPSILPQFPGTINQAVDWEVEIEARRDSNGLFQVGFITLWEVQSQLATLALLALVALVPIWVALSVMIVWSLAATSAYLWGRRRGLPDLLEHSWSRPPVAPSHWLGWLKSTSLSAVRAWAAGLQPLIYSRTLCRVLTLPATGRRVQVARALVLGLGLTMYGVSAAHHMLRKAQLSERQALQLSYIAPFLHVPYRILLGAIAVNAMMTLARPFGLG
jgi:hypothetical protein